MYPNKNVTRRWCIVSASGSLSTVQLIHPCVIAESRTLGNNKN